MTKKEFMLEIEDRLRTIPLDERIDALRYYQDYFAEAGITDDMAVPESMDTPENIAKQIIEELSGVENRQSYMDENGDVKNSTEYVPYYKRKYHASSENGYNNGTQNNGSYYERTDSSADHYRSGNRQPSSDAGNIVAIILLVVFSPVWIGLGTAIIGLIFSVLVVLGSLCFAAFVTGATLIISAFFTNGIAGGILLCGCGMVSFACGVLLLVALVLYCARFLPWLIKGIVRLCKSVFGRRNEAA